MEDLVATRADAASTEQKVKGIVEAFKTCSRIVLKTSNENLCFDNVEDFKKELKNRGIL